MAFLPPAPLRPLAAAAVSPAATARLARRTLVASSPLPPAASASASPSPLTRRAFLALLATSATSAAALAAAPSLLPARAAEEGGLAMKVVKAGKGPAPQVGDLVGIRFKAAYNGVVFDNLFESSQPYFYRVGSDSIVKGIDETVQTMKVGDVVDVTIPSDKAFGKKGRRASPGKPSIPPDAEIFYTIELSTIPGREDELLEGLSDNQIGDTV